MSTLTISVLRHKMIAVKRLFQIMPVLWALVGLFGQAEAFAIGPKWEPTPAHAMAMPMSGTTDCVGMSTGSDNGANPCKGLSLACIAAMGCVPSFLVENLRADPPGEIRASLPATWPVPRRLIGRVVAPAPYPPSTLD